MRSDAISPRKQQRRQWQKLRSRLLMCSTLNLGLALVLTGCAGFRQSLHYDDRMLVKIPGPRVFGNKDAYGVPVACGLGERDRREYWTVEGNGWYFRHVAEAPRDKKNAGNWYVAYRGGEQDRHVPTWKIFRGRWERVRSLAPTLADAAHKAFGVYPSMIEPNLVFARIGASKQGNEPTHPEPGSGVAQETRQLFIGRHRTEAWPSPSAGDENPAWHLGDDYTQLTKARARLEKQGMSEQEIVVAILDNGFERRHAGGPVHLEEDAYGDALDWVQGTPVASMTIPGNWGSSHGTGTLGILAGRRVAVFKKHGKQSLGCKPLYEGSIGGAPNARIVPVRVAPWVFSIETASLAYGIDYASRIRGADVLSMSHGGSPSQAWVDAVNAAYERGTAIFAAEGDFFSIGFDPLPPAPIITPSSPVYPAAFRRVMGVTGVTSDGGSYARNKLWRLLSHPQEILAWVSRGNYGPDGWRKRFDDEADADPAQKRLGQLRAYPIAAYSPNIPWLAIPEDKKAPVNLVDLDGAGTSAATPQTAAAAALWLAKNKETIGRDWKTWKKTEAAYFALLASAQRKKQGDGPDRYLGAGVLKANDALDRDYTQVKALHSPLLAFPKSPAPRDWFDGSRSFHVLLFGESKIPSDKLRARLKQDDGLLTDRQQALKRIFYNALVLEQWHKGRMPLASAPTYTNGALWKKGEQLAENASSAPLPIAGRSGDR